MGGVCSRKQSKMDDTRLLCADTTNQNNSGNPKEDGVPAATAARKRSLRSNRNSSSNNCGVNKPTKKRPHSPTQRASSYTNVHDAVASNFLNAVGVASTTQQSSSLLWHKGGGGSMRRDGGDNSNNNNSNINASINNRLPPGGVTGLDNLGNTCFLNAALQCLSNTIPLTDYFLGYNYHAEINATNPLGTGGVLATAYAELIKELWLSSSKSNASSIALVGGATTTATAGGVPGGRLTTSSHFNNTNKKHKAVSSSLSPKDLVSALQKFAPQFQGHRQQDSQEALAILLDAMHEDLNRIAPPKPVLAAEPDIDSFVNNETDAMKAWRNYLRRDKSLIVDVFQGQLRSRLTCRSCKQSNVRFEPFMYLPLPITKQCKRLQDCLELYLQEETLTGVNQWYCSRCKTHRDATKKIDLWILPPILLIHLKRFTFNEYGQMGAKNTARISYPVASSWDLSAYVHGRGSEDPLYDLYAVSNHVGTSSSGGHYTAYAQNRFDDAWYEYNDATCRPIRASVVEAPSSKAYVLFYNRIVRHDDEPVMSSLAHRRAPLIRRQSASRPELWPHTQVQGRDFREFSRRSKRSLVAGPALEEEPDAMNEANSTTTTTTSPVRWSDRQKKKRSKPKNPNKNEYFL